MPLSDEITYWPERHLICWFPSGKLDKVAVMEYFQVLQTCPWGSTANRFCDFSGLTSFDLGYEDVAQVAEFRKRNLSSHAHLHLVIYSSKPIGFGLGRMYESVMEGWDLRIAVVGELERAAAVLGVEPGLLRAPGEISP